MIDHEELSLLGTEQRPGLLDLIRRRELLVPEFQREFLWARKPDRTTRLLASIAQEWPAGALLLMEGDRGFQTRPVQGWRRDASVGVAKHMKYAILDGQQRMTALYQALYNRSPTYVFAVEIIELLRTETIDPEEGGTFRHIGKRSWEHRYGSPEKQREAGLISLGDLVNPKGWEHWKDGFASDEKADLNALREDGPLSGLLRYQFPVSIVLESAPDEALSNIFVTINEQGIKLTTFDLVVARTVKRSRGGQKGFNLREVWSRAAGEEEADDQPAIPAKYERLRNYKIEPEVPLKLVRLIVDSGSKLSDTSILRLAPTDVHQRIQHSFTAVENVLEFLEDRIGMVPPALADPNYLLPVALAAHTKPAVLKNKRDSERVLKWWWCSTFRAVFGRGQTGDLIPVEAAALSDWLIQHGPEPSVCTGFWSTFNQELRNRLFQGTAQNQHIMRAMFALEVAEGAIDWKGQPDSNGKLRKFPLSNGSTWPPTRIDIHHVWARGVKKPAESKRRLHGIELPFGDEAHEAVINRTLLLSSTNIVVGNTPFPAVRKLEGVRPEWVGSYLVEPGARTWRTYVEARLERITKALRRRVPAQPD